jgi:hypothetical protein
VNTCHISDQEVIRQNWRDLTVAPFRGRHRIDGTKGCHHQRLRPSGQPRLQEPEGRMLTGAGLVNVTLTAGRCGVQPVRSRCVTDHPFSSETSVSVESPSIAELTGDHVIDSQRGCSFEESQAEKSCAGFTTAVSDARARLASAIRTDPNKRSYLPATRMLPSRLLNARTNAVGVGVGVGRRITGGWQQSLMGERIRYRGNCRGCQCFAEPLIVGKEESSITLQWPSDSSAELIADKLRDWIGAPDRSSSWRRVGRPDIIPTKIRETGYCPTWLPSR